jgi:hypothetical protein
MPEALRLLSMIFVPATAVKEGKSVLHGLQEFPLSVEYLNSSVTVPAPPIPEVTSAVRVVPAHTLTTSGDFVSPGATG